MSIDERLREELGALLDGALPDERAAALRRRLADEPALRREYEELERTVGAVRSLGKTPAPDALREGLTARLDAPARGRISPLRRIGAAAAALALATTVALFALRDDGSRPAPVHTEARRDAVETADEDAEGGAAPGMLETKRDEPPRRTAGKSAADRETALEAEEQVADGRTDDEAPAPERPQEKKAAEPAPDATLGGRVAGAKERAESGPVRDLLKHVETGGSLTAAERLPYIRRLDGAGPALLDRHLETLAREREQRQQTFAQAAGGPGVTAEVRLRSLAEAKGVRALLQRRFKRAAAPAPAGDLAARARAVSKDAGRAVELVLEMTPQDARRLLALLERLDTAPAPPPAGPRVGAERRGGRGGNKKAKGAPATITVRLRYDPPPEEDK